MRSEPEAKGRFQHPLLVALLTAVVTIPLTGLTTRWIEQAKSADALAVAHQTERRGALRLESKRNLPTRWQLLTKQSAEARSDWRGQWLNSTPLLP